MTYSLVVYILLPCIGGWQLALAINDEPSVHWYIRSAKIVIGESLELFCNTSAVQNDCNGCPTRWHGGPNKTLLSLKGYPYDTLKHQTDEASDGFTLIIKNLTKDDLHKQYSCSYGPYTHEKHLTLEKPFEHHPNRDAVTVRHELNSGSMLNVTVIFLEVHPTPNCSVYFNEEDLSSELKNESEKIGISYRIRFELQRDIQNHSCKGTLQIKCRVGFRSHDIITTDVNYSCERDGFVQTLRIIVTIVLVILFVICIIGVKRGMKEHKFVCKTYHNRHEPRKDDTSTKKPEDEATKNLMEYVKT